MDDMGNINSRCFFPCLFHRGALLSPKTDSHAGGIRCRASNDGIPNFPEFFQVSVSVSSIHPFFFFSKIEPIMEHPRLHTSGVDRFAQRDWKDVSIHSEALFHGASRKSIHKGPGHRV